MFIRKLLVQHYSQKAPTHAVIGCTAFNLALFHALGRQADLRVYTLKFGETEQDHIYIGG